MDLWKLTHLCFYCDVLKYSLALVSTVHNTPVQDNAPQEKQVMSYEQHPEDHWCYELKD